MYTVNTVKISDPVVTAECVGSDTAVSAVVAVVSDVDAQTECDGVCAFVVRFNAMTRRTHHPPSILLPVASFCIMTVMMMMMMMMKSSRSFSQ